MLNPSTKSCVVLGSTHHRVKLEVHFGEDLLIFHVPIEDLDALGATLAKLPDSTNILTSILARGCRREGEELGSWPPGGGGAGTWTWGGARVLDTGKGRGCQWDMDTRRGRDWVIGDGTGSWHTGHPLML